MNPSVVQTGAEVQFYKVNISVEGNGEVSGINTYSVGEFAKVSAYPAEGEKFLGWYQNGKLISKDAEYRFCVKENTTLVAKFTDKRVKVGNKYKIKKHTYKVTSVKKRTVSFVKTTSKSKTIKIPSTVKINGKKYKVTTSATGALKGNKKVIKVIIGSNVTKIGKKAFYNCKRLKNITIKSKKLKKCR